MALVQIALLGRVDIGHDGVPIRVPGRKTLALMTYLAACPGETHSRDKLAALLWGDAADQRARHSVRQALATIRAACPVLIERGDNVAIDASAVDVDVRRFEALAAKGTPEALERAVALCRGELAEGLAVSEPAFEEWLLTERIRLREVAVHVLARVLAHQTKSGRTDDAIQTALRLVQLDSLQEAVHRALMRLYAAQGRRGAALRQYQTCLGIVRRELGAEPEAETRALYVELLQTAPAPGAAASSSNGSDGGGPASRPDLTVAELPLMGRAVELAHLERARRDAWTGHPGLALVSGEAGIGKSRLVAEMVAQGLASEGRLLFGRAYQGEQLAFGPWVDALRSSGLVTEAIRDHLVPEPWHRELARLFPEFGTPRAGAARAEQYVRLFEAFAVLLRAAAGRRPLLVVLEDLHWIDELSIRLLTYLHRHLIGVPVLFVGTVRDDELDRRHPLRSALADVERDVKLARVELAGLSEADTTALVQFGIRVGGDPAAVARFAAQVWNASAGNPFVIVETMRSIEGQRLPAARLPLPRRVKELITARLDRLSDRARTIVMVAAVLGREFDFALLGAAAGGGAVETAEAVEELVGRRILHVVGERVDFTHDRILEAAYGSIAPTTRQVLHRAIGEALQARYRDHVDEVVDRLGHHFSMGGEPRQALVYLVRSAELAAQRYALDDALAALEQARTAAGQLPGGRDHAVLDVALRQAFVLSLLGRQREIQDLLRAHAEHLASVGDATLTSEYHFRVAITHFYQGEQAESYAAAERALAEAERAGDDERIGKALHVLAVTSYALARPRIGIAHATRAIGFLDRPHTQHWLGLVHYDLALNAVVAGDLDTAIAATGRCRDVGLAAGDPRLIAESGCIEAWTHALRAEHDRALDTAARARETSQDPMAFGLATGVLGLAYLQRGDHASAIPRLREALEKFHSIPVKSAVVRHLAWLSEAHLSAGEISTARAVAGQALATCAPSGSPFDRGLAERVLGRIALAERDWAAAADHFGRALTSFAVCESTFEIGQTHVHLAEVSAAQGDHVAAHEHLDVACGVFEAANAPRRVAAARAMASALETG